ncbi:hypothetical protein HK099_006215, partial [Clydaea vesicula]
HLFFMDESGSVSRSDALLSWTCDPKRIVYANGYVLACEDSCIEVREINTGKFIQIIPLNNHMKDQQRNSTLIKNIHNDLSNIHYFQKIDTGGKKLSCLLPPSFEHRIFDLKILV